MVIFHSDLSLPRVIDTFSKSPNGPIAKQLKQFHDTLEVQKPSPRALETDGVVYVYGVIP